MHISALIKSVRRDTSPGMGQSCSESLIEMIKFCKIKKKVYQGLLSFW